MPSLVSYSQLEKFPFPRGSFGISEDSVGPIYATVNMQSTAEEKQQAAQDKPLGGSILVTQSLCARHMHG